LQCLVTLTQFAGCPEVCAFLQPLEEVSSSLTYKAVAADKPGGSAVWDAICFTLQRETSRHVPVFCIFLTDCEENASRESDLLQVQAMITTREEWGNWRFFVLNLQDRPSRSAAQLHVDCIDSSIEKMGEALIGIARRICRDVARLGTGGNHLLLEEGGRR
jgi:hypothetical protein